MDKVNKISDNEQTVALDIATGRDRNTKNWKNRQVTWQDLLTKLSKTHRTAESHAEYLASKKARQDEIKDIGGFVGGYLANGRRKKGSVTHRQLVTLDADFATADFWFDFTLSFNCAACIYSTHKHSPDKPRLRLIIPLDREVMADEYIPISRRIAAMIGIEAFDHTSYQAERLMYWPSTAKDGEFVFEKQDGPLLCADDILNTYHNWKDASEWPMGEREKEIPLKAIKEQEDPLSKKGTIGLFCTAYPISEAIETFLPDVYEACDIADRYSYKEGSTAAGLIVYDDKFAFSHHGTDPISGKLCNAFDLVRIHKYGFKDDDAKEGTPPNRLPSFVAMMDFAAEDAKVLKLIGERVQDRIAEDFAEELETEETNSDWVEQLKADSKGKYLSTRENAMIILQNDPRLKARLALDEFENRPVALKKLPWREVSNGTRYLTDADDAGLRIYLDKYYGISNRSIVEDCLISVTAKNAFHPVRDYLNSLKWDGQERVETLLIDYLGVTDNKYTRAITRKMLAAAVTRVFRPGCKFDYVLVLIGSQGQRKSMLLSRIGRQWFSDSFSTVHGKEAIEQIQGVWIVEMGELAGLKKAEVETIKHYISKPADRYRVAYGRRVENFPRQCVFFATSNNRTPLRDASGGRRFWITNTYEREPVKNVDQDLTDQEVGQIWAEAVQLYKAGEKLYLDSELELYANQVQADHSEQEDRAGMIQDFLSIPLPDGWDNKNWEERKAYLDDNGLLSIEKDGRHKRTRVCAAEIACELFRMDKATLNPQNTRFIHEIMQNLEGWKRGSKTRFSIYGNSVRYYTAGDVVKHSMGAGLNLREQKVKNLLQ